MAPKTRWYFFRGFNGPTASNWCLFWPRRSFCFGRWWWIFGICMFNCQMPSNSRHCRWWKFLWSSSCIYGMKKPYNIPTQYLAFRNLKPVCKKENNINKKNLYNLKFCLYLVSYIDFASAKIGLPIISYFGHVYCLVFTSDIISRW